MWGLVAAAIAAVTSATVGAISSKRRQRRQAEYQAQQNQAELEQQQQLNEEAYQRNLEQWNRENEYNKPVNQMKRYQEAGLNPNLIYSQGTTSVSSPVYQAAQVQHQEMPYQADIATPIMNSINQVLSMAGDLGDSIMAAGSFKEGLAGFEARYNQAQLDNVNANTQATKIQNALNGAHVKNADQLAHYHLLTEEEKYQSLVEQRENNIAYRSQIQLAYDKLKAEYDEFIETKEQRKALLDSDVTQAGLVEQSLQTEINNKKQQYQLMLQDYLFNEMTIQYQVEVMKFESEKAKQDQKLLDYYLKSNQIMSELSIALNQYDLDNLDINKNWDIFERILRNVASITDVAMSWSGRRIKIETLKDTKKRTEIMNSYQDLRERKYWDNH